MWWDRSNLGRCGDHRSCRHQFLSYRIDLQVQPFERVSAEERHVSRFREHNEIGRFHSSGAHESISDVPLDATSVRDFECLCSLRANAEVLEHSAWNPGVLAPRIDQGLRQGSARAAHVQILDFNRRAEDSHVVHDKSFAMDRDTISLPATSNLRVIPYPLPRLPPWTRGGHAVPFLLDRPVQIALGYWDCEIRQRMKQRYR